MNICEIDFLHPKRSAQLGKWVLVIGVAMLFVAIWLYRQHAIELDEQNDAALQREAMQRQSREAAERHKAPTADEKRIRGVASQLQQPWLETLRVIEGATEAPIYLLSLGIDPASGKVRLDAESPDYDRALSFVQRLSEAGALKTAQLVSHEEIVDPSGKAAVRLSIVAEWNSQ